MKSPLQILLVTLTIIFLVVTATLLPFSAFASSRAGAGSALSITNVIALLVCLAPTTIGALLSSIGIAGMSRLNQANVLAMSGRAIEAAGDTDVLLLDKTGTITLGNRQARTFFAGQRRYGAGTCGRRPVRLPCRRNGRGKKHRRTGKGDVWHTRPGTFQAQRELCGIYGKDANERHRLFG